MTFTCKISAFRPYPALILINFLFILTTLNAQNAAAATIAAPTSKESAKEEGRSTSTAGTQDESRENYRDDSRADRASSGTNIPSSGFLAQPGVSIFSLPGMQKNFLPSQLGFDFYFESDLYPQNLKDRTPGSALFSYWAGPRYDFSSDVFAFIHPQWSTSYSGASDTGGEQGVTKIGDVILGAADKKTLSWKNKGNLLTTGRIYLPTGEASRNIGQKALFYGKFIASQPISSRLTLSLATMVNYWVQSRNTAYQPSGKLTGTPNAEINPYGMLGVSLFKHCDFTQLLGADYTWIHGDRSQGIAPAGKSQIFIDSSLMTDAIDKLTLIAGVNNEPTMNGGLPFKTYRDSDIYYYFIMLATL